jgi:hypothetical protein
LKDNLDYFTHDTDARNHPKIKALKAAYGKAGIADFWTLNEIIGSAPEGKLDISKKITLFAVASDLDMKSEELQDFISFLADPEIDLINFQAGIITTDRTQEDLGRVLKKRETSKKQYEKVYMTEKPVYMTEKPVYMTELTQSRVEKSKNSRGGGVVIRTGEPEKPKPPEPPPPLGVSKIRQEALNLGFAVDEAGIRVIVSSIKNPDWFRQPHSILAFASQRVRERHPDRPLKSLKGLFYQALASPWEDLVAEYPAWREEQAREESVACERKARASPVCPKCGKALRIVPGIDRVQCKDCQLVGVQDFEKNAWVFAEKYEPKKILIPQRAAGPPAADDVWG